MKETKECWSVVLSHPYEPRAKIRLMETPYRFDKIYNWAFCLVADDAPRWAEEVHLKRCGDMGMLIDGVVKKLTNNISEAIELLGVDHDTYCAAMLNIAMLQAGLLKHSNYIVNIEY